MVGRISEPSTVVIPSMLLVLVKVNNLKCQVFLEDHLAQLNSIPFLGTRSLSAFPFPSPDVTQIIYPKKILGYIVDNPTKHILLIRLHSWTFWLLIHVDPSSIPQFAWFIYWLYQCFARFLPKKFNHLAISFCPLKGMVNPWPFQRRILTSK